MTSNIVEILKKEKELNKLLNSKSCPVSIDDDFKQLFSNRYYLKTRQWLDPVQHVSLHDSKVKRYSQRKNVCGYDISFKLDNVTVKSTTGEFDTIGNTYIKILSKESLRMINDRYILSFLIDEENKEIAFIVEDNGDKKIVSLIYITIELNLS